MRLRIRTPVTLLLPQCGAGGLQGTPGTECCKGTLALSASQSQVPSTPKWRGWHQGLAPGSRCHGATESPSTISHSFCGSFVPVVSCDVNNLEVFLFFFFFKAQDTSSISYIFFPDPPGFPGPALWGVNIVVAVSMVKWSQEFYEREAAVRSLRLRQQREGGPAR